MTALSAATRFIRYIQGSNEGQLLRIPVMHVRFPHDLVERRWVHCGQGVPAELN